MTFKKLLCGGPAYIEITISEDSATHKVINNIGEESTTWSMPYEKTNFQSKRTLIKYCHDNGYTEATACV